LTLLIDVLHDRTQHRVLNRILSTHQVGHDVKAPVTGRKQSHGTKVGTFHAIDAITACNSAPFQDFLGF
jgi:hypothetical protein